MQTAVIFFVYISGPCNFVLLAFFIPLPHRNMIVKFIGKKMFLKATYFDKIKELFADLGISQFYRLFISRHMSNFHIFSDGT